MSWNYTVHRINQSFDQITVWYQDFMKRTEQSFRYLHQRIAYLEERDATQGPSDEQVERILRKILAEKFAGAGVNSHATKDHPSFVERRPEELAIPRAIPIDIATLEVDPSAVPSEQYRNTFAMLEGSLQRFPNVDLKPTRNDQSRRMDAKPTQPQFKTPNLPRASLQLPKPWS
ncbi:hypothetical protein P154DRAFT_115063 [Amniculicola lignicola CBS 123094]|uniref:Uncharacterized protein n=1 Tax=Amniculicola lignicola CBS 123094 TaxID=1392246 RepID=A0A6A5X0Q4_9PLEO|nr:hypothetical protein P154DRAFT_115063 [Amniculicola lignicola CBS 123094]